MNDAHAAQASGRGFDKEFRQGRPRLFRRQSMEIDLVGDAELAPPQASKIGHPDLGAPKREFLARLHLRRVQRTVDAVVKDCALVLAAKPRRGLRFLHRVMHLVGLQTLDVAEQTAEKVVIVVGRMHFHSPACGIVIASFIRSCPLVKILISNDDGYQAEGLVCLARHLRALADIVVVAPERNRSGASNSLTLDSPLRVTRAGDDVYFVNGTPTDCVHLAVTGLLDDEPDMVVSGVNDGANLGDDVLYSGTVAAATEGRFLGLPAVAVSLVNRGGDNFEAAARVTARVIGRLIDNPLPKDTILNINVPDLPYGNLGPLEATRLGNRHRAEPVVRATDPRGRDIYWVGAAGPEADAGPGTDFYAVANGVVSVTPLQVDLTRHRAIEDLARWLNEDAG